jgi:hypothetical protein
VSKTQILGTYFSDRYVAGGTPNAQVVESFAVDVAERTVETLA